MAIHPSLSEFNPFGGGLTFQTLSRFLRRV